MTTTTFVALFHHHHAYRECQKYRKIEDDFDNVLEEKRKEKTPNAAERARKTGIGYQKLNRRFNGKLSKSTRAPTNKKLNSMQEDLLEDHLRRMDSYGLETTLSSLNKVAYEILEQDSLPGDQLPARFSPNWGPAFRERHPYLFKVKQKALNMDRKMSHDLLLLRSSSRTCTTTFTASRCKRRTFRTLIRRVFVSI